MIHPIFKATLKHPALLIRHLANYGDLLRCEATDVGKGMLVQAIGALIAAVSLLLALGLTGVAIMLGVSDGRFHWALVAVPATAWIVALVGALVAIRSKIRRDVEDVCDEVELDLKVLRLAKGLNDERRSSSWPEGEAGALTR